MTCSKKEIRSIESFRKNFQSNLGNTVLVIEHHLDVIKVADHIIDMGPEGGIGGGEIVAQGTPEQVASEKKSATGKFLAQMLA